MRRLAVGILLVLGLSLEAAQAQAPGKWIKLAPFPEPSEELYGAAVQRPHHHVGLARLRRAGRPAHRGGDRGAWGGLVRGWGSRQFGAGPPGGGPGAPEVRIYRMQRPPAYSQGEGGAEISLQSLLRSPLVPAGTSQPTTWPLCSPLLLPFASCA